MIRPMLAATVDDISALRYPLLATPKIDGIRCLMVLASNPAFNFRLPQTRNGKPIPNLYIKRHLSLLPPGLDGELECPGGFNATQSAVMSKEGTPPFTYRVFDLINMAPYNERLLQLATWCRVCGCPWVSPVLADQIDNEDDLLRYEALALEKGYEGVMLRKPDSPYKHGRSTFREHYLLKLKRFQDSEAVIEDFEEQQTNENEATTDAYGLTERSSHKSGLCPAGTLGAIWVRDLKTNDRFSIGTGFDNRLRKQIWNHRDHYRGLTITYKYQPSGMKDLPRFPVFKGFMGHKQ